MKEEFNIVMDIGEQMLLSGAEVHRVEDSIERMCRSFGAISTDVFIITSSIVVTIHMSEGVLTQTRRIKGGGTDIEKLHKLNELSRKICAEHISLKDISDEFYRIKKMKKYPVVFEVFSYAVIASAFTVFFGGGAVEAAVSLLIGCLLYISVYLTESAEMNKIFSKFISSFFLSVFSYFAVKLGAVDKIDNIMIGNIMLLIPGIGLTNALRDLLTGDSIAGLLRLIEASISALAIAAGYFVFVFCFLGV